MTTRTLRGLAIAAIVTFVLSACSASTTGGVVLKIGYQGALTGNVAVVGVPMANGGELAIDQAKGTISGVTIEYVKGDDQVDPAQAPAVARKLIQDKNLVAVLGPIFGSTTNAAGPIYTEAGVAMLSFGTAKDLTSNGWTFYRLVPNDDLQGNAVANYVAKVLKLTKIAVIDDGTQYGNGLAEVVASVGKSSGLEVVTREAIDPKADDFSATIAKILADGAEAVFLGASFTTEAAFNRQLGEKGFTGPFFAPDGSLSPDFVSQAGPGSEGTYFTCQCAPVPAYGGPSTGPLADFVSAYQAKFNEPPQAYSAEAFDGVNIAIAAIKSGARDRAAVLEWLKSNSYEGIARTYSWDATGEPKGETINLYQIKDGKVQWLGTTDDLIK